MPSIDEREIRRLLERGAERGDFNMPSVKSMTGPRFVVVTLRFAEYLGVWDNFKMFIGECDYIHFIVREEIEDIGENT